jgi:hypothetical protein
MPESLNSLETQRAKILQQFLGLGDLRPGSISAFVHRCGKSYCHCRVVKNLKRIEKAWFPVSQFSRTADF